MKKALLMAAVLLSCASCVRRMTTEERYTAAYASLLEQYVPGPRDAEADPDIPPDPVFTLLYLDDDGIPELAVADGEEPWDPVRLFRFDERTGKAEAVGEYSMYGQMYYIPRTGYFLPMYFVAPGSGDVLLFRDGEVEAYASWSLEEDSLYANGEKVSEEEFTAVSEYWISADWTPVFEEGRTWRLGEVSDLREALAAADPG